MSSNPPRDKDGNKPGGVPPTFTQEIQHANISARVPEKVARGVFSTGAMLLQGPNEFVLDFVLRMSQPHQVVARVILPIDLMPRVIDALKTNMEEYRKTFGAPPPSLPMPQQPPKPPSIEEIYDSL